LQATRPSGIARMEKLCCGKTPNSLAHPTLLAAAHGRLHKRGKHICPCYLQATRPSGIARMEKLCCGKTPNSLAPSTLLAAAHGDEIKRGKQQSNRENQHQRFKYGVLANQIQRLLPC